MAFYPSFGYPATYAAPPSFPAYSYAPTAFAAHAPVAPTVVRSVVNEQEIPVPTYYKPQQYEVVARTRDPVAAAKISKLLRGISSSDPNLLLNQTRDIVRALYGIGRPIHTYAPAHPFSYIR
eukprot:TRINITY_DN633_c0_g1_i1.p1 TRINITY_DN633_c0_g1~~TRINITY_DN633_c0_g1_i1.p1  ORF type:complete len:129 (+),score=10.23 TRINITY_DN633_c0_g1_i1:23-388(+)